MNFYFYLKVLFCFLFLLFFFINFLFCWFYLSKMKLKAFESGFSSLDSIKFSFSIHFYLILLIFVLFDMEVVLMVGFFFGSQNYFWLFFLFFIFILMGLIFEWKSKKLVWLF